jgi:hypothetical protein
MRLRVWVAMIQNKRGKQKRNLLHRSLDVRVGPRRVAVFIKFSAGAVEAN